MWFKASLETPSPKQSKMYWMYGSSRRMPGLQAPNPEFKTPFLTKIIYVGKKILLLLENRKYYVFKYHEKILNSKKVSESLMLRSIYCQVLGSRAGGGRSVGHLEDSL
jgi:hypothetical protein